ncbi:MAG TPA: SRPBCC family protein [Acidimicrobiales bacterium]|nr:SRPBCC family protein [Acidimicrobiales bacterium]
MFDIDQQLHAVRREVGSRTLDAGEARMTTLSQSYDATVDEVWDACTNPERIPRWFLPISGDLRLGGRFQLEGNAGGTIERCDPPNSFSATWEYADNVSWIEVRVVPEADGRTRFELAHGAHVDDAHWVEFGPAATGVGWDLGLLGLATHLASGADVDHDAAMAWSASDEGRRFIALSSQRWCDADVAAGADPADAQAAADRTTAAYTGGQ